MRIWQLFMQICLDEQTSRYLIDWMTYVKKSFIIHPFAFILPSFYSTLHSTKHISRSMRFEWCSCRGIHSTVYVKWNTICDKWADLICVVKQYIKVTTLLNQPLASRFRLYPIVSNMHLSVRNDGGGRRSVLCLQREEMARNEWMNEWMNSIWWIDG